MIAIQVRKIENIDFEDNVLNKFCAIKVDDGVGEGGEITLSDSETSILFGSTDRETFDLRTLAIVVDHTQTDSEIFYVIDGAVEEEKNVEINGLVYDHSVIKDTIDPGNDET